MCQKQGGDPVEFRLVNDAYKGLISHITKLQIIEAEAELSSTSVVIEISKHSLPKWWDKLKTAYGKPKTANVANAIFQVKRRPISSVVSFNLYSFKGAVQAVQGPRKGHWSDHPGPVRRSRRQSS